MQEVCERDKWRKQMDVEEIREENRWMWKISRLLYWLTPILWPNFLNILWSFSRPGQWSAISLWFNLLFRYKRTSNYIKFLIEALILFEAKQQSPVVGQLPRPEQPENRVGIYCCSQATHWIDYVGANISLNSTRSVYSLKSHNDNEEKTVSDSIFVKRLMFSPLPAKTVLWIFIKDLSQGHVDAKGLGLN